MTTNWYYVENNDRIGPVTEKELLDFITSGKLNQASFVWKKGFDNWKQVSEVDELKSSTPQTEEAPSIPSPVIIDWDNIPKFEKIFMIKIGMDRGVSSSEYGPFNLGMLKRLFDENRINEKTYVFTKGMENWKMLADIPIYEDIFGVLPPQIQESDRRVNVRKPFVARLFFHDNSSVFEGICRDVSIGGLQILVADAPVSVGDSVSMNVHPENTDYHFMAKGQVVRVLDNNSGFSLRFENLEDAAKESINDYIASI